MWGANLVGTIYWYIGLYLGIYHEIVGPTEVGLQLKNRKTH